MAIKRRIHRKPPEEEVVPKSRRRPTLEIEEKPEVKKETITSIGITRVLPASGVPTVYVEKGVTKNMGDFNSARVTIGMSLPIDYTPEELDKAKKTIAVIDKIVVARLETEMEQLFE